jgi:CheY-like chemotaxis protein
MASDLVNRDRVSGVPTAVLAIDDDEIFLDELSDVLQSSGYEVTVMADSRKAIEAALKIKPKVILMDINMPGKSGLEVAYEMRYRPALADIPIIAMSGFLKESNLPFMEACGIKKYLKKPFNPLDIIWHIEDVLKIT